MKMLIVLTDSHSDMYQRWFLPSLPCNIELVSKQLASVGRGIYNSDDWKQGVMAKLHHALDFCRKHPGEIFLLSDVDIQFFKGFEVAELQQLLENSGCDVLLQKESRVASNPEVNTGFYIARATPWFIELLTAALELSETTAEYNDQILINKLLEQRLHRIKWDHLPLSYYARSQGFPPKSNIVLHHANMTASVEQKHTQLTTIRQWVAGGYIGKIKSLSSEALRYLKNGQLLRMLARRFGKK